MMRRTPLQRKAPRKPARRDTGFPAKVKLLVRARAAGDLNSPSDPEEACCEGCGIWLGLHGGQVHHRLGRQAGGCKLAVVNSCANALLLCGTPFSGCHGLATAWDDRTAHAGIVLEHGNGPEYDPRYASVIWHALGPSGIELWLGENGEYLLARPEGMAA